MYAVTVDGREVLSGFLSLRRAYASRRSVAETLPKARVEVTSDPASDARWHVL